MVDYLSMILMQKFLDNLLLNKLESKVSVNKQKFILIRLESKKCGINETIPDPTLLNRPTKIKDFEPNESKKLFYVVLTLVYFSPYSI